MELDCSTRPSG